MFHKSNKHTHAILLKHLLVNHRECPGHDLWPQNVKEWGSFMDMAHRNKLFTLLYHFLSCNNCNKITPKIIQKSIPKGYLQTLIRYKNYQKIKQKIRQFIKETGTPLILIKDLDAKLVKQYYPPYYVVQKFDIDIFGKYQHFLLIKEFMKKLNYSVIKHPLTDQYKFKLNKKKVCFPQVEFRYQAINNTAKKTLIFTLNLNHVFSAKIWRNAQIKKNGFTKLLEEYLFIQLCLIYYFEDNCMGLNNLYRVWLLYNNGKNTLDWEKIWEIAKRYKVKNVVNFVLLLSEREFQCPLGKSPSDHLPGVAKRLLEGVCLRLALRLMDSDYICRAKLPGDRNFNSWKDGYLHFLTRGLLEDKATLRKLIFFIHPKRLVFLVRMLFSNSLK